MSESVVISRPPSQVFAFLADLSNLPKWQTEVVKSEVLTQGPTKLGTRFMEDVKMGPMRTKATCEVIEFAPDKVMAFSAKASSMDYEGKAVVEAADGGAKLTMTGVAYPKGFWKVMQPLMGGEFKRGVKKELAQIKALVEKG